MKQRYLILLAFLICSTATLMAVYPYIYRNDRKITRIDPREAILLSHSISEGDTTVRVLNDMLPHSAIDSIVIRKREIPVLRFSFPDFPELDWVVEKEKYVDAKLDVEGNDSFEDMNGLELTVKGRGNTSWGWKKKPMRLKFTKKISICGFKKAKSYVLLANYIDASHMKNAVALWLSKRLGMEFANSFQPVHVYVNDRYQGLYLLTEKVGINSGSVDIDEETGMLFEFGVEFDEKYKFESPVYKLPVMVKDPDLDEICEANPELSPEELLAAWEEDFLFAEREVYYQRGASVFDLASAVDFFLVMNFCLNREMGFPKSVYVWKEKLGPDALYHFGPVWDFDVAFNFFRTSADYEGTIPPTEELWVLLLLKDLKKLPEFKELYYERLAYFHQEIFPELLEWMEDYSDLIEPASMMDGARWTATEDFRWCYRTDSFENRLHYAKLLEWISKRMEILLQEEI